MCYHSPSEPNVIAVFDTAFFHETFFAAMEHLQ
jgi:hypothetical protein